MKDRILKARGHLRGGDVVIVAVKLTDRQTGEDYWWRRFACVTDTSDVARNSFVALSLKPTIDEDKDIRRVDITKDVVRKVEPAAWPQGVDAMRMKYIHLGKIVLDSSV